MNTKDIQFGALIAAGITGCFGVTLGLIYVATLVVKWAWGC